MTKDALDKLVNELEYLTTTKRREIADRIQRAKDLGDLSENAEYTEAKEAHGFNEGRIGEIEVLIKNSTVVTAKKSGRIGLGSIVKVKAKGGQREYEIVSFNEADPINNKISNESPIGQALVDQKKGDKVTVSTPKGNLEFEIIDFK
ncbi:transcription elongation factor GreA [Patescibacteria group bacterium]|nr:transcription elongation factor GreA [Patescibacteria group bacterium]